MRAIILFISFFIVSLTSAQDAETPVKRSIKLYNLFSWEPNQVDRPYIDPSEQRETTSLRLLHPTIGYNWQNKKGNGHEIELTNLRHQTTDTYSSMVDTTTGAVLQVLNGSRLIEIHLALRYEYMLNFNRTGISRWSPSLGAAISPYFRLYQDLPIFFVFPTNEHRFGAMIFLVPRISYRISDRLHFDLNMPICFSDSYYKREPRYDPDLVAWKKVSSFNFQSFPAFYSLRAGIGVTL